SRDTVEREEDASGERLGLGVGDVNRAVAVEARASQRVGGLLLGELLAQLREAVPRGDDRARPLARDGRWPVAAEARLDGGDGAVEAGGHAASAASPPNASQTGSTPKASASSWIVESFGSVPSSHRWMHLASTDTRPRRVLIANASAARDMPSSSRRDLMRAPMLIGRIVYPNAMARKPPVGICRVDFSQDREILSELLWTPTLRSGTPRAGWAKSDRPRTPSHPRSDDASTRPGWPLATRRSRASR